MGRNKTIMTWRNALQMPYIEKTNLTTKAGFITVVLNKSKFSVILTSFCSFQDFRPVETIHGAIEAAIHPHLWEKQAKIFSQHLVLWASAETADIPVCPAARRTSAHRKPSPPSRCKWRSLWKAKPRDINHNDTGFMRHTEPCVSPVPVLSVVGVFEPEVHSIVQLCPDVLTTLLQLHRRHGFFQKKKT